MRFVSINDLIPGMVLARPFIGELGALMLSSNTILTEGLVKAVQKLQYSGLYIRDEFSEGIEPDDLISQELRNSSVGAVQRLMIEMKTPTTFRERGIGDIQELVDKIVNEILNNDGAMVNLIDLKSFDLYTFQHSVNVCVLSCAMGAAYGFSKAKLNELALAAILHDIGKVFVPISILNKPGALSPEEFEVVKKHANDGGEYVRSTFHFNNAIAMPIKQHHERYDGQGYPMRLAGGSIHLFARIVTVADVYDAIMSKRPYHEAVMPSEAYEYVMGNSGAHFDPEIVTVFIKTVLPFPIGVNVLLSNGMKGLVFKNNPSFPMRPLIKIEKQSDPPEHFFLDLSSDPNAMGITIKSFL